MPDLESVLAGLNEAQREAALALRGPVAILAGAGTGKTTTITHRIGCQVRSGAFEPSQILAVTFTDKAAGELRPGSRRSVSRARRRARSTRPRSRSSRGCGPHTPARRSPRCSTTRLRSSRRSPTGCPRRTSSSPPRARRRDRVGEEPDDPAREVPRRTRRPRAADPRRPDASRLRRLRAAQALDGAARFRGHARARAAAVRRASRGRPAGPVAVRRVHRGRVSGREPAPGRPARTLARRPRRPVRGR